MVEFLLNKLLTFRRICIAENEVYSKFLNPDKNPLIDSLNDQVIEKGYVPEVDPSIIDTLEKFQRYKTSIMNNFHKTLHELERLKRIDNGENISAPITCDVNLNSTLVEESL